MSKLDYPITLRPLTKSEGGGWLAEFPDLPGCMADGATPEEAMREAADAARSWIRTAKAHGDPIVDRSLIARSPALPLDHGRHHAGVRDRAAVDGVSLSFGCAKCTC